MLFHWVFTLFNRLQKGGGYRFDPSVFFYVCPRIIPQHMDRFWWFFLFERGPCPDSPTTHCINISSILCQYWLIQTSPHYIISRLLVFHVFSHFRVFSRVELWTPYNEFETSVFSLFQVAYFWNLPFLANGSFFYKQFNIHFFYISFLYYHFKLNWITFNLATNSTQIFSKTYEFIKRFLIIAHLQTNILETLLDRSCYFKC